ncbi:MAG TPA: class I SAM-dependent methyltransferase [Candidatus Binatia bacterium]|jgi:SAM-dependent methyltransferase
MSRSVEQKIAARSYRDSHTSKACAADYEAHYARGRGYLYWQHFEKPYLEKLFARLGKEIPGRYLDFACGTGRVLQLATPFFSESVGIDVSEGMLAVAQRNAPTARLIRADPTVAPPEVGTFAVISLFRFLLNAEDPLRKSVLSWLRSVIAPEGVLVVNNHLNRYSISGAFCRLRNLARRGHGDPVLSDVQVESLLRDCGFRIFERYGFGLIPPSRHHGVFPGTFLLFLEKRLQRIEAARKYTQDRIYLCRPV